MASTTSGFSDAERAAMKERSEELRAQGTKGRKQADNLQAVLDKIAEMSEPDGRSPHAFTSSWPRTRRIWRRARGTACANAEGKIVCFFQPAGKFDTRYSTLGFNDSALLDDGNVWPAAFAITKRTASDEKRVAVLIRRAVGA